MGKADRIRQRNARERIAAQQAAAQRAEARRRILIASSSVFVVLAIVVGLVIGHDLNKPAKAVAAAANSNATVASEIQSVPASTLNSVGRGDASPLTPTKGSNPILTSNGKPLVLYMGAEYCPYCAAQRWAMVNALSRFGTFTGLTTTHSSSTDADPNTPTWTFYGSTYKSNYINFTSVEETKNYRTGNTTNTSVNYVTLQTPTAAEEAIGQSYDPQGSIPFIDLGNKYVQVGNLSPLSPTMLAGLSWSQVAADMNNPSSSVGQAEIGNANYMTAGICKLTNNLPATACTPTIQKLETAFAS